MRNTMSHRAYFNGQTSLSWSHNSSTSTPTSAGRYRNMRGCCSFRIHPGHSEFSPLEFLKHLAERVATALSLVSAKTGRTRTRRTRRPLPQDSPSASSSSSLGRSNSRPGGVGGSVDSFRTEAVEDCIQFIHSSFSRSNSSANSVHHTL